MPAASPDVTALPLAWRDGEGALRPAGLPRAAPARPRPDAGAGARPHPPDDGRREVDAARALRSQKRGGDAPRVPFDEHLAVPPQPNEDLLVLDDEALTQLADEDPRQGRVVEPRYFGGLSVEETAEVLGISAPTVMRDWGLAKLWLVRALRHREDR